MALSMLLFAAQAAGYGLDMYQRKRQERYTNQGAEIDRQELGLQFEREQLASSEEALFNADRLKDVMSNQRAMYAARGQMNNQGTPIAVAQNSVRTYAADERARQISLSFRKHQLDSAQRLSKIGQSARRSERKTTDLMKGLNLMSFNSMGGGDASGLGGGGSSLGGA